MEEDPFDTLLDLENEYYNEGYELGTADGKQAGHIEGRLFGLEKGFEKFLDMGRLQGISTVWSSRLSYSKAQSKATEDRITKSPEKSSIGGSVLHPESHTVISTSQEAAPLFPHLPESVRLEKQLRIFHALVEAESLSTQNSEEAVSDFDDRLKRAMGKAKIIEKFIGEETLSTGPRIISRRQVGGESQAPTRNNGDGSIEEVSSVRVRQ